MFDPTCMNGDGLVWGKIQSCLFARVTLMVGRSYGKEGIGGRESGWCATHVHIRQRLSL